MLNTWITINFQSRSDVINLKNKSLLEGITFNACKKQENIFTTIFPAIKYISDTAMSRWTVSSYLTNIVIKTTSHGLAQEWFLTIILLFYAVSSVLTSCICIKLYRIIINIKTEICVINITGYIGNKVFLDEWLTSTKENLSSLN